MHPAWEASAYEKIEKVQHQIVQTASHRGFDMGSVWESSSVEVEQTSVSSSSQYKWQHPLMLPFYLHGSLNMIFRKTRRHDWNVLSKTSATLFLWKEKTSQLNMWNGNGCNHIFGDVSMLHRYIDWMIMSDGINENLIFKGFSSLSSDLQQTSIQTGHRGLFVINLRHLNQISKTFNFISDPKRLSTHRKSIELTGEL